MKKGVASGRLVFAELTESSEQLRQLITGKFKVEDRL